MTTTRSRNDGPPASSAIAPRFDAREAYARIQQTLDARQDEIVRTLVPTIPRERFLNVALQAITRTPKLLECTPASIVLALRDAAELGLEPSGLLGQAYLVPYRNRSTGRFEAKLIPGYRGLIDLARRSGQISVIEARAVRAHDVYEYEFGTTPFIRHVPFLNRDGERETVADAETGEIVKDPHGETVTRLRDGGPFIAVYIILKFRDGGFHPDQMSTADINAIRRRSKAGDDGPWVTDWSEMAKKTLVRRTLKYAPIALVTELNRALELEEEAESEAAAPAPIVRPVARQRFLDSPDEDETPEEKVEETGPTVRRDDEADPEVESTEAALDEMPGWKA